MQRWIQSLAALATGALLAACGGGGEDGTRDLADTARAAPGAQAMVTAMDSAGITSMMKAAPALTLLLPSDEALAPYAEDMAELRKPENRAALEDFVKAHVVDGTLLAEQLKAAAAPDRKAALANGQGTFSITVRNLHGEELTIEIEDGVLSINGAVVGRFDIRASNGVLHILNQPLFRPSVFAVVARDRRTSILEAAIREAGLAHTLRGPGPLTLFAPTDDAFVKLLAELKLTAPQLLGNKPLLTQVLTYHVLATRVLARQIEDDSTPVTVQGQAVRLDVTGHHPRPRTITVTDARGRVANVTRADLRARNGVVHLIDRVILPADKSIVQIASGLPQFSILVEAVTAAGLGATLSEPDPFTVFAPTNDAFVALLAELGVDKAALLADKALLTQVLTYHVLGGRILQGNLSNGLAAASLQGQPLKFVLGSGGASITDARGRSANIVATNVQASNGVIHVIDKVILPTPNNLVQLAQSLPQFSILVEAVVAAGLADTLSAPGPYTVFAPTNDAFVALLGELGTTKDALLANKPLLTAVLSYHVVRGQVLSSGIPFGAPIATVQGEPFTIGTDLRITDARGRKAGIVATDVAASNGVVHVIDRVILPR